MGFWGKLLPIGGAIAGGIFGGPAGAAAGAGIGGGLGSKGGGGFGGGLGGILGGLLGGGGGGGRARKGKFVEPLRKGQRRILEKLTKKFPAHKLNIENQKLYGQGYNYLSDLLSNDPRALEAFQAPYLRQFREEILPSIAERFTQLGGQKSSAFNQALAQQATGLTERLAALRSGMQMQAVPQALQYLQVPAQNYYNRAALALGTPGRNYIAPGAPQPGLLGELGGGIGQGLGIAGGQWGIQKLGELFS